MNKELNIDDYVRTKEFGIKKVAYFDNGEPILENGFTALQSSGYESSPNIIDLIQEGDYVNGDLVYYRPDSDCDEKRQVRNIDMCGMVEYIPITSLYKIKSIVTKEQFESMKYEVD